MTFEEITILWLKEKRNYIKESTYALYNFECKHYLFPMLGNYLLDQVTEELIQNTVWKWQKIGMKNGNPLKQNTVQNLVVLLKQILKYASKKGHIKEFVLDIHFVSPQNPQKKDNVFDYNEQEVLINAILLELSYKSFGILLCICTGIRIGELCALKWSDIDFSNGIIHITKTLQRVYYKNESPHTQVIIGPPKTLSSIRDIPMNEKIYKILNKLPSIKVNGYILTNSENYMEPRVFRKFYDDFLKKHQIKHLRFHCLRHTFATRCIENGADYKVVSELLGHTSINTTINMYVHPRMEEKRKCVEMLQW